MERKTGSETATAGSTVLVVAEDDGTASLLERELGGARVESTADVSVALERVEGGEVACVVSTDRVPGGGGIELLSTVRELDGSLPFVLLATDGSERLASRAIAAGVTDYVLEGDSGRLVEAVERALRDGGATGEDDPVDAGADSADGTGETAVDHRSWPHPDGLFVLEDGVFVDVDERFSTMFGYEPGELVGVDALALVAEEDHPRVSAAFEDPREAGDEVVDGSARRYSFTGVRRNGDRIDVECNAWPSGDDPDLVVGAVLDVTGREAGERQLAVLREVMRGMMQTKDKERIGELAVETAVDLLDPLVASVSLYDGTAGSLRTVASDSAMVDLHNGRVQLVGDEGIAWDAFVRGEDAVVDDVAAHEGGDPDAPVRSEIVIPLGDHGVLAIGDATRSAFDERDLRFARTLATTVEMALDRADREQTILERTDQLREQNEQLDRLRRIDAIVRDIGGMLVRATGREAIERGVCERLAEVDHWQFVWIGERPVTEDGITARAWAGSPEGYLAAVQSAGDDRPYAGTPAEQALDTGDPQVRENVVATSGADAWRRTTLDHGFRSVSSIPLRYEHREYGVLEVYGDNPSMFGDEEAAVLAELANMVAYAINAVEREQALFSDAGPEIEVSIPEDETDPFFTRLARAVEGEVVVDGIVRQGDGTFLTYLSVPGTLESIEDVTGRSPTVQRVRSIGPEDGGRYEVRLAESDLFETVAAHGASIRGLTAGPDACAVRIELPVTANLRQFVEAFQSVYPGAEVMAQRSTFDAEDSQDVAARFTDLLTDRQREVLRVAYHSGFFEWPRESTGEDLADALEVSPPTVHKHLRAAERKLLAAMLGERKE
jgi:PAS domain S-box-containing protein